MKKYLILLLLIPITCYAKTFDVVDLKIDIDDDKYVIATRDNISSNEELKKLGIKEEYFNNYFNNTSCYLDAVNKKETKEILIYIKDVDLKRNLHKYKEDEIKQLEEESIKSLEVFDHSIYSNDKYKYITMYYLDNSLYVIDYYTAINGKGYTIKYQSTKEITDEEKDELKNMINNISFRLDDSYEKGLSKFDFPKFLIVITISAALGALTAYINIKRKRAKE